jgi:hypothetical protein
MMIRPSPRVVPLVALLAVLLVAGCAQKLGRPTPSPSGDEAPVTLRNLQIETIDGHRAVLMRLSRFPSMIRHSSSRRPAEITVQAWGPVGEGDLPERALPQLDPLVSQVRVSRRAGGLTIVLDLHGDEPPPYSVHQMADWIMVRFSAPES